MAGDLAVVADPPGGTRPGQSLPSRSPGRRDVARENQGVGLGRVEAAQPLEPIVSASEIEGQSRSLCDLGLCRNDGTKKTEGSGEIRIETEGTAFHRPSRAQTVTSQKSLSTRSSKNSAVNCTFRWAGWRSR